MVNYWLAPSVNGNSPTTPDSAGLSITGDIDIRLKLRLPDWTPSVADTALISKFGASGQRSWRFFITNTNALAFEWSANGSTLIGGQTGGMSSSVAPAFADGTDGWVRATLDVDNGASGYTVRYYTSTDGTNWTQLGVTRTAGAAATSIFDSTTVVEIGSRGGSGATDKLASGARVYFAEIRSVIDGTVVGTFNPDAVTVTGTRTPNTYTDPQGNVWTMNGSAWDWGSTGASLSGDASEVITAGLTSTAALTKPGAASEVVTAGLSSTATATRVAAAALVVAAGLTATATVTRPGDTDLSVTAVLSTSASVAHPGDGSLPVTAGLTGAAAVTHPGDADTAVTADLTSTATVTQPGDAALDGSAGLTATGTVTRVVDAEGIVTATIQTAGLVTRPGDADTPVTVGLTAAATITRYADADLSLTAAATGTASAVAPTEASAARTYAVAAEVRVHAVPAEDRAHTVPAESRVVTA